MATGQLIKITENSKIGYALLDVSRDYKLDIGTNAIDFSFAPSDLINGTSHGACGDYSFAVGQWVTACNIYSFAGGEGVTVKGDYSLGYGKDIDILGDSAVGIGRGLLVPNISMAAFGQYNEPGSDAIFEIGIGGDDTTRKTAFRINDTGTALLPEFDSTQFATADPKQIITIEYLDAQDIGFIQRVTENSSTGYIIRQSDRTYKGIIGLNAFDLSRTSNPQKSTYGATGWDAFARGVNVTAGGKSAFASGSVVDVDGDYGFGHGYNIKVPNNWMTVFGKYNVGLSASGLANKSIFEIGIGTSDLDRRNAMHINYDGLIFAPYQKTGSYQDSQVITYEVLTDVIDDIGGGGTGLNSFEVISKNLHSYTYTLNYDIDGTLQYIEYDTGTGTITKTLNYDNGTGDLNNIVLSGDIPYGILTTKTLNYVGTEIDSISYS